MARTIHETRRIGAAVARRGKGFNVNLLYRSRNRKEQIEEEIGIKYVDPATLLAESDFMSIHTSLTPETRHLIGYDEFAGMKQSCILVNTSRDAVTDRTALYEALSQGRIALAALDVTNPLLTPDNIITPHIGSAAMATGVLMDRMVAENLFSVLDGKMPPSPVNPAASSIRITN